MMKKCPFCAEDIQDEAKVCKHCSRDLKTGRTGQEQPHWNKGIAAVLSLVIPGAGQLYKGQIFNGLAWFIVVVVGYAFFILPGLFLHLFCIIGATMGNPYESSGRGSATSGTTLSVLAIGVILLIVVAAIAVPGLLRARRAGNEASAIGSLRAINSAQKTFAASCGYGSYAPSLAALGTAPHISGGYGFIGPDVSSDPSIKSEYSIALVPGQSVTDAPASCNGVGAGQVVSTYFAVAVPLVSGARCFATNSSGVVYQSASEITVTQGWSPSWRDTRRHIRDESLWAVPFDSDRLEATGTPVPVVEGVWANYSGFASYAVGTDGMLAYTPADQQITDLRSLVWVDRNGREEPIGMRPRAYVMPRLSPDGRRLVVDTRTGAEGTLFLFDLETHVEEQFTFVNASNWWPIWTLDGSQIVFTSNRHDGNNLYVKPADGSGGAEPVSSNHRVGGAAGGWSADGETLVWSGNQGGGGVDIFTVQLDGDSAPEPLLQTSSLDAFPTMSPNGRWMAYLSDETGERRIYVRPFPDVANGQRAISDGPGEDPLWGRDGRELFYQTSEDAMVVAVETGDTFQRGSPQRLFSLDPYHLGVNSNWDVSPDGDRFLMVKRVKATDETPIIVVLNWFEELTRLVPTQ